MSPSYLRFVHFRSTCIQEAQHVLVSIPCRFRRDFDVLRGVECDAGSSSNAGEAGVGTARDRGLSGLCGLEWLDRAGPEESEPGRSVAGRTVAARLRAAA